MDKPTKPTKKDCGLIWYQCQLAGVVGRSPFSGSALVDRGILSCPLYVVNAGATHEVSPRGLRPFPVSSCPFLYTHGITRPIFLCRYGYHHLDNLRRSRRLGGVTHYEI